jgi:hypothetical protein
VRTLLRFLLIGAVLYLAIRYLFRIFSPKQNKDGVQGKPRSRRRPIDDERITDASFKDISEK